MNPTQSERRPATILVWLGGALGDTLLGYPALAALRAWAPRARLTLIGRPSSAAFARSAGLADRVVESGGPWAGSLFGGAALLPEAPELAVIWSAAYASMAQRLEELGTRVIIAAPPRPAEVRHQARYLLDCLRPLGIPRVLLPAPPPPLEVLPAAIQSLVPERPTRTILLHPGAGSAWKLWPLTSWLILAEALANRSYAVRWSFGPEDARPRAAFLEVAPAWRPMTWPELPLAQFAALLAQCALFVSADTGVAHLAALLRVPQVTLFGSTDPRRWRPLSRFALLARAPNRHGCDWDDATSKEGPAPLRRCVEKSGESCACLAELSPEAVLSYSLQVLARPNPSVSAPE
ncbi:MAG: glycosyltransferase family 9 protein [Chloroflexota bacterium]